MEKAGLKPNVMIRSETVEGVKSAVRAGGVLGMLYQDNLASEIERGEVELVRVAGCDMRIDSTIVYSRRKPLSPAAEEFLKTVREPKKTKGPRLMNVLPLAPLLFSDYLYPLLSQAADWLSAAML